MAVGDAGYQQGSKGLYPWTNPEKSGDVNAAGFSPGLGSLTPESLRALTNSGAGPGRFSNIVRAVPKAQYSAGGNFANRTYHSIRKAPCETFYWVRLVLKNGETSTVTVDGAALAVTNTALTNAQRIASSQGTALTNDSATGWVQATFGGANSVVLPARIAANRASKTYSDWMRVSSIAPIDGSTLPYIMGRVYMSGSLFTYQSTSNDQVNVPDAGLMGYNFTQNIVGGGITDPSTFTSTTNDGNTTVFGFEFQSDSRALSLMVGGDSISQGQSDVTSQYANWSAYGAQTLRAAGKNVSVYNAAWSGVASTVYSAISRDELPTVLPDYFFYSVYSPNDGGGALTQAVADAQFATALDMAQYCISLGVVPVLTFIAPNNNLAQAADDIRKALIARCKATGFMVCDLTPALGDGATPERYKAGLNYDPLHPTPAGYQLAGAYFAQWCLANLPVPSSN